MQTQSCGSAVQRVESVAPQRSLAITVTTVILLIALNLPFTNLVVRGTTLAATLEREGLYWMATAIILAYVRLIERRPLSSIGLKFPTWKSLAWGALAALVALAGLAGIYLVLFPALHLSENTALASLTRMAPWLNALIIIRAAVFEEIFYRGFTIERITELTHMRWLAAIISLATFTYAHVGYWGWSHLFVAGFGGLVLTALYLWRRDLASNMIAHFLTDAIGFLLAG
jgi:uncharacterized protein